MSMWLEGQCHEFRKALPRKYARLGAAAEVAGSIISPMPGKIIQVRHIENICCSSIYGGLHGERLCSCAICLRMLVVHNGSVSPMPDRIIQACHSMHMDFCVRTHLYAWLQTSVGMNMCANADGKRKPFLLHSLQLTQVCCWVICPNLQCQVTVAGAYADCFLYTVCSSIFHCLVLCMHSPNVPSHVIKTNTLPLQVLMQEGETAEEGDAVVVLEAMKMEHTVRAPCAGLVSKLQCFVGAQVEDGYVLAIIEPQAAAA